jgi:hypothetical protein
MLSRCYIVALVVLAAVGTARADTIVLPTSAAGGSFESVGGGPLGDFAVTAQVAFVAGTKLIPSGSRITGIGFRLDESAATGPASDMTFSQWDLQISRSLRPPASLSATFADNIAADVVLVRSGPLTVTADSLIGGGFPNPFMIIPFTVPYTYTGGNLLLTLRKSEHTGDEGLLFDAVNEGGFFFFQWGSVVQSSASATSGFVNAINVPVTQLVFERPEADAPLPGTLSLLGLSLAGFGWSRRGK